MWPLVGIIILAVIDQVTKFKVAGSLYYGEQVEVIPGFLNLTYLHNTGAAFSIFQDQSTLLAVISFLVLLVLSFGYRHFVGTSVYLRWTFMFLAGGILGNLIDRVKYRYVIDFLDVYAGDYHWPAFNVADSAICIGVGLYLLHNFLDREKNGKDTEPEKTAA